MCKRIRLKAAIPIPSCAGAPQGVSRLGRGLHLPKTVERMGRTKPSARAEAAAVQARITKEQSRSTREGEEVLQQGTAVQGEGQGVEVL